MAELGRVTVLKDAIEGDEKTLEVTALISDPGSMEGAQGTPAGVDSRPLLDDIAIGVRLPGSDEWAIVGYLDLKNGSTVSPGETKVYSREASGDIAIAIDLKKNGTIELGGNADNALGFAPTKAGFDQMRDQINTQLTAIATGISGAGGAYAPVPLTASIDAAKIDVLKVP